jgi:nucleoside-diphosphate-sugar epimerase
MNILLTGSSGFFGRCILSILGENNLIFTLSRTYSDYNIDLMSVIPRFNHYFETVIHAAGLAHFYPKTREEIELFYEINVKGTINLLSGLESYEIPKNFVFISTVAVYGENKGTMIKESSKLNALEAYGKSKLEAEKIITKWCAINNVKCTILRLPLLVGNNPPGNLGNMIRGIQNGFYFNISGGIARKSMVLADDVAKYILIAAEVGGIFNLTDGYHPSFNELSLYIARKLRKKRPINLPLWIAKFFALCGDVLGHDAPINSSKLNKLVSDLTFDDAKAREEFGWNPKPVLSVLNI